MVATYPCTNYSPIADIHGVRTGDDLFLHFFRNVAIRRPELYVVENVPGIKKFPVVMEAMTELPDYYVHVACPIKSSTWLPQERDRLIIIGSRRRFGWREPAATKPVPLNEILESEPTPHIPEYVSSRLAGKYRDRPIISDPERGDIAPTCVAHYAKDLSTRLVADPRFLFGARPYTVRKYAPDRGKHFLIGAEHFTIGREVILKARDAVVHVVNHLVLHAQCFGETPLTFDQSPLLHLHLIWIH